MWQLRNRNGSGHFWRYPGGQGRAEFLTFSYKWMPLLSFLQHSEACFIIHLEVGHGSLLSDDFLEGRVHILFVAVCFIEGSGQGVFTVSFIGYFFFSFSPCRLTPENVLFPWGWNIFQFSLCPDLFFFFLLLSGEHRRRRCQGNGARGGDSSTI